MNITKQINEVYNIIKPDGSGNRVGTTFVIKNVTENGSYVGDIYDADRTCIASDRRFLPIEAITDQLNLGEIGLVNGTNPDDTWAIPEIKTWLDSKQAKDSEGETLLDDPYAYTDEDTKESLLAKITVEEVM